MATGKQPVSSRFEILVLEQATLRQNIRGASVVCRFCDYRQSCTAGCKSVKACIAIHKTSARKLWKDPVSWLDTKKSQRNMSCFSPWIMLRRTQEAAEKVSSVPAGSPREVSITMHMYCSVASDSIKQNVLGKTASLK